MTEETAEIVETVQEEPKPKAKKTTKPKTNILTDAARANVRAKLEAAGR